MRCSGLVPPACRPSVRLRSRTLQGEGREGESLGVDEAMENGPGEQDTFDTIVMAEARFHSEGYQEGYSEGTRLGVTEGRQYGVQQGANIGLEIGSYLGFAMTWLRLLQKSSDEKHSKKVKVLESLIEMIQKFPNENPVYDKLQEDLDKIRGRFKQVCSLLHIPPDIRFGTEGSALAF